MTTTPAEKPIDLTRWNRAGLSRFQFSDGNAANWLDFLRKRLRDRLAEAELQGANWPQLNPDALFTPQESLEHLGNQYINATGDHGWEILRSFARAIHVCTTHLDAYTNEGYLRTATQWESLRRLIAMLDYSPAPPASASTSIALLVKEGLTGTVTAGLQLNDKPTKGSPLTFETLADLDVDARLNQIHVKDWNKSQELFALVGNSAPIGDFPVTSEVESLSAGSFGVLQADAEDGETREFIPIRIRSVSNSSIGLTNLESGAASQTWKHHQLTLHSLPKSRAKPLLAGDDTLVFAEPVNLAVGEMLAWNANANNKFTRFLKVKAVENRRVRVELKPGAAAQMPGVGDVLFKMVNVFGTDGAAYVPLLSKRRSHIIDNNFNIAPTSDGVYDDDGVLQSERLVIVDALAPYRYVPNSPQEAGTVTGIGPSALAFSGKPRGMSSGSPIVLEFSDDSLVAAAVQEISETDEGFDVILDPVALPQNLTAAYWDFQNETRPTDYDKNVTQLTGEESLALELDADDWPDLLVTGREIILHDADLSIAAKCSVATTDPHTGTVTLSAAVPAALDAKGIERHFTKHASVFLANVITAGHGESTNLRVLGSGDASNAEPEFDLDLENISFVADATFPSGVRADVEVTIGNRIWTQVGTIRDSTDTDSHYEVRPLSDGGLQFRFNRRLPTGSNNVFITVRKGVGLVGNLGRDSLVKLKQPYSLVTGVLQPLDASGGSDIEPTSSMRENAPESILTLNRAVSISDFSALATAHASIWQAQAFAATSDRPSRFRGEMVRVVAVPAGGGLLEELKSDLRIMLQSRAMPGVVVQVDDYRPLEFDLKVRIRIDTGAYDPDQVAFAVKTALESTFKAENRTLGDGLYRSQIYTVVEAIEGVQDSVCRIVAPPDKPLPPERIATFSGVIRALRARGGELLIVRDVAISYAEYAL